MVGLALLTIAMTTLLRILHWHIFEDKANIISAAKPIREGRAHIFSASLVHDMSCWLHLILGIFVMFLALCNFVSIKGSLTHMKIGNFFVWVFAMMMAQAFLHIILQQLHIVLGIISDSDTINIGTYWFFLLELGVNGIYAFQLPKNKHLQWIKALSAFNLIQLVLCVRISLTKTFVEHSFTAIQHCLCSLFNYVALKRRDFPWDGRSHHLMNMLWIWIDGSTIFAFSFINRIESNFHDGGYNAMLRSILFVFTTYLPAVFLWRHFDFGSWSRVQKHIGIRSKWMKKEY